LLLSCEGWFLFASVALSMLLIVLSGSAPA